MPNFLNTDNIDSQKKLKLKFLQVVKPNLSDTLFLMLRRALTKKSIDHSNSGNFSFSFFCDKCGKEWKSSSQPFTSEDSPTIENKDALKLLWGNEHRAAFDEANLEAHLHFNLCPICGRRVCDDCFNIAEKEHGGACKDCCVKEEEQQT